MKGPTIVLALFTLAQAIAAATMLGLGNLLNHLQPDAGWIPWTVVGVIGVTTSVAFLVFTFNWKRWIQWPARAAGARVEAGRTSTNGTPDGINFAARTNWRRRNSWRWHGSRCSSVSATTTNGQAMR